MGYYFYVELVWDSSSLDPQYIEQTKQNYVSEVLYIQTLNPGETTYYSYTTSGISSDAEGSNVNTSPSMMVYSIPLTFGILIHIKRRGKTLRRMRS